MQDEVEFIAGGIQNNDEYMDIIRTPADKENIANMKQLYKFLCHMLKMNIPETISLESLRI